MISMQSSKLTILLLLAYFLSAKIILADVEDLRKLLQKDYVKTSHKWKTDITEISDHMPYGFDEIEGEQYSIICSVGEDYIPGKINKGKANYTQNFEEKECLKWKFVEGRLVHELDFSSSKCRYPLGKVGDKRFYNGVVHLKTGLVVGKVYENLNVIEYSRNGVVEIRKNNFYIIC